MNKALLIISIMTLSLFHVVSAEENNLAIGYQVGGNSLIGASYEFRVTEVVGFHLGAGFLGFDGGLRIHFNKEILGPYVDFNYKNTGFGLMQSIALELGGTYKILDESGPHASVGIQKILSIDDEFKERLVGDNEMPSVTLAFQAGWAWEL